MKILFHLKATRNTVARIINVTEFFSVAQYTILIDHHIDRSVSKRQFHSLCLRFRSLILIKLIFEILAENFALNKR